MIRHEYGPPAFVDGSPRSITVHSLEDNKWKVFIRTGYVQCMREGVGDPDEGVLSIFEEYKKKLTGEDKLLFKSYFKNK